MALEQLLKVRTPFGHAHRPQRLSATIRDPRLDRKCLSTQALALDEAGTVSGAVSPAVTLQRAFVGADLMALMVRGRAVGVSRREE